jgi:hypothetical protein
VIDLGDTSRCPLAGRCVACGATSVLAVQTAATPVGVICLTLCAPCTEAGELPRSWGMAEAVSWSLNHCRHLGITADDMDATMSPTRCTVVNYGNGGEC